MAKQKPSMSDLFKRTEPAQDEKPKGTRRRPIGLYLRNETLAAVQEIAEKEHLPIHGLLVYGVTYFIRQYRAGKVKIEKQQTTTLNIDL